MGYRVSVVTPYNDTDPSLDEEVWCALQSRPEKRTELAHPVAIGWQGRHC